jgi:hypothetical protein
LCILLNTHHYNYTYTAYTYTGTVAIRSLRHLMHMLTHIPEGLRPHCLQHARDTLGYFETIEQLPWSDFTSSDADTKVHTEMSRVLRQFSIDTDAHTPSKGFFLSLQNVLTRLVGVMRQVIGVADSTASGEKEEEGRKSY